MKIFVFFYFMYTPCFELTYLSEKKKTFDKKGHVQYVKRNTEALSLNIVSV
jgi:hypothetical protein